MRGRHEIPFKKAREWTVYTLNRMRRKTFRQLVTENMLIEVKQVESFQSSIWVFQPKLGKIEWGYADILDGRWMKWLRERGWVLSRVVEDAEECGLDL